MTQRDFDLVHDDTAFMVPPSLPFNERTVTIVLAWLLALPTQFAFLMWIGSF